MKKVVLSLAVIATVACLASCSKTCTCTTTANGKVVATETGIDKGENSKCSDMNKSVTYIGVSAAYECEAE